MLFAVISIMQDIILIYVLNSVGLTMFKYFIKNLTTLLDIELLFKNSIIEIFINTLLFLLLDMMILNSIQSLLVRSKDEGS